MDLRPVEECVIASPDAYGILNDLKAGNYDQKYYIEKEGLQIDLLSEEDEEEQELEEVEDILSQEKTHEDPPETGNVPTTSSRTFDDLVNITFSHPTPSPGITLKELASLHTSESRIDPHDQSSTFVTTRASQIPEAFIATPSFQPPAD